jgi:AsmA protein
VTFSRRIMMFMLVCMAAVIGILWIWPFSTASFPARIAQQLEAQTGFQLRIEGKTSLVLFPVPRLKMTGVHLTHPASGAYLEALHLRGDVRLSALLLGRLELADMLLKHPRLRTVEKQEAHPSMARGTQALLQNMIMSASHITTLQRVTFVDGTWEHHWLSNNSSTISEPIFISQINGVVAKSAFSKRIEIAGSFWWREQGVDVRVQIPLWDTVALTGQTALEPQPAKFTMISPLMRLHMNGALHQTPDILFNGELQIETRSMARTATWLEFPLLGSQGVENASLKSPLTLSTQGFTLSSANLTLNEDVFDGALSGRFARDGMDVNPVLSGTLATSSWNAVPFLPPLLTATGEWNATPWDTKVLSFLDLDLRISAARAYGYHSELSDVALSLFMQNGRLDVSLGQARFLPHGKMKGRLSVTTPHEKSELEAKGSLAVESLDLSAIPLSFLPKGMLNGKVSAQFSLESQGKNVMQFVRSLNGKFHASVLSPVLQPASRVKEANIFEVFGKNEKISDVTGHIFLESGELHAEVKGGLITLRKTHLESTSLKSDIEGDINILERTCDFKTLMSLRAVDADRLPQKSKDPQIFNAKGLCHNMTWQPVL